MLRKALIALVVIAGLMATTIMVSASIWPTINRVEAGKTIEYPDILPKTYQLGYDRVYDETLAAAKEQPNWMVTMEDRAAGKVQATATMDLTGWTQQIDITVKKRGRFVSRVYISSEGSDAPGDLGQNARNITTYYEALDRRLGAASVDDKGEDK